MSSEWQVLKWLNYYSPSQLSPEIESDLRRMKSQYISEADKTRLLDSLMTMVPLLVNILEQAELEANCGLFWYARGFQTEAVNALEAAQHIYEHVQDFHRRGIIEWLLYIVHQGRGDPDPALAWADRARIDFWGLADHWASKADESRERWYRDSVYEISSEMIILPGYIFSFMFEFQGSHLSASAEIIRGKIDKLLRSGRYDEAFDKLSVLRNYTRHSPDAAETGEALAYCGFTCVKISRMTEAVRYLKLSAAQYIPRSLEHTLVGWMLALILFSLPDCQTRGVEKMEASICTMRELATGADHQNQQVQYYLYHITAEAMSRGMKRMISSLP